MEKGSEHKHNLQSYFKGLCNSFYIAHREYERLSIKCEELQNNFKAEKPRLKTIQNILQMKNNICDDYITFKCSIEELEKRKEEIESIKAELEKKEKRKQFWFMRKQMIYKEIEEAIKEIVANGYTIIIDSEAEVYALIEFFYFNSVIENQIVDNESNTVEKVNTEDNIYEKFLEAYSQCIEHEMDIPIKDLHLKYIKYY